MSENAIQKVEAELPVPEKQKTPRKKLKKWGRGFGTNILTPLTHQKIVDFTAIGHTRAYAAAYAKISRPTLFGWLSQGRKDVAAGKDTVFARLAQDIEHADALGLDVHLKNINRHAKKDWRASAWIIERRHLGWEQRQKAEISGPDGEPLAAGSTSVQVLILPAAENLPP